MHAFTAAHPDLTPEDQGFLQRLTGSSDASEADGLLLAALERQTGLPAVLMRLRINHTVGSVTGQGPLAEAGHAGQRPEGLWRRLTEPGPLANSIWSVSPVDQSRWVLLPMAGQSDLFAGLAWGASVAALPAADGAPILDPLLRAAGWLADMAPLLDRWHRRLAAEREHRWMACLMTFGERILNASEPVTLRHLIDLAVPGMAKGAWFWVSAGAGKPWTVAVERVADPGQGSPACSAEAIARASGAWGPVSDLASRLILIPVPLPDRPAAVLVVHLHAMAGGDHHLVDVRDLTGTLKKGWVAAAIHDALAGQEAGESPTFLGVPSAVLLGDEEGPTADGLDRLVQQAGTMAHMVRNKLNVVTTGIHLLRARLGPGLDDDSARLFKQVDENIHASSHLISDFMKAVRD